MIDTHKSLLKRQADEYIEAEHGFFITVIYDEKGHPVSLRKGESKPNSYTVRTDSGLSGTGRHDG